MAKPIIIDQFVGMNNIKTEEGRINEPRLILNADVNTEGQIIRRAGYQSHIALPGSHSLAAFTGTMLCAAGGKLYELRTGIAVEICSIDGPTDEPLDYAKVDHRIYISNKYWKKIYDPSDSSVSDWGIPLPDQPVAVQSSGNMPSGVYRLCFTRLVNGELSGNGLITEIYLDSDNSGISILNRDPDEILWLTDPNGETFYKQGDVDSVSACMYVETLPTFLCSPPPFLENIVFAFGRMWGSVDNTLYYSEPYKLGLFRLDLNKFEFPYDITLVASTIGGLFVGTKEATYSLLGANPAEMRQTSVGTGSVPGTLTYCNNVKEMGDVLSPEEKIHNSVPIWVTQDGIVIGNASGRLFNLSNLKTNVDPSEHRGASLYRSRNGVFQFLSSFRMGSIVDEATTAMKKGRLFDRV